MIIKHSIADLLNGDLPTLVLDKFSDRKELPGAKYYLAVQRLKHKKVFITIHFDREYTTDPDDLLSYIRDRAELDRLYPDAEVSEYQVGDDLLWKLEVCITRDATPEELADAQAVVDAGPPPLPERVEWRRPVAFIPKKEGEEDNG